MGDGGPWNGEDNVIARYLRILSQKSLRISCHFHRARQTGDFRSLACSFLLDSGVLDAWECRMPQKSSFYFISLSSSLDHSISATFLLLSFYLYFAWNLHPQQDFLLKFKILSSTCTSRRTRKEGGRPSSTLGQQEKVVEKGCQAPFESGRPRLCSCFKHLVWIPWTVVSTDQQEHQNIFKIHVPVAHPREFLASWIQDGHRDLYFLKLHKIILMSQMIENHCCRPSGHTGIQSKEQSCAPMGDRHPLVQNWPEKI